MSRRATARGVLCVRRLVGAAYARRSFFWGVCQRHHHMTMRSLAPSKVGHVHIFCLFVSDARTLRKVFLNFLLSIFRVRAGVSLFLRVGARVSVANAPEQSDRLSAHALRRVGAVRRSIAPPRSLARPKWSRHTERTLCASLLLFFFFSLDGAVPPFPFGVSLCAHVFSFFSFFLFGAVVC
nr:hypothetical protein [Pandoravirus massiliensis]